MLERPGRYPARMESARPRPGATRCAYCHADLTGAGWECEGCGTRLHHECRPALEVCPTLGCGGAVAPESAQRAKRRTLLRALGSVVLLVALTGGAVVVVGAAALFAFAVMIGAPWAIDRTPARRHLADVDLDAFVREARAAAAQPRCAGSYWDDTVAQRSLGRVKRPEGALRPGSELPTVLRALAPLEARVGDGFVTLTWDDDRSYGYGYSLLIVPADHDEANLTENNGSFHYTTRIADGLWCNFAFH